MLKQDWAGLNSKKLPISIMRKIEKKSPSFFIKTGMFLLIGFGHSSFNQIGQKKGDPYAKKPLFLDNCCLSNSMCVALVASHCQKRSL